MLRAQVLLALLSTTPAFAGVLPGEGIFGNASGCRMYMSGERAADAMLLTPDSFSAPAAGCDFVTIASQQPEAFTVESVCSPGGQQRVVIAGAAIDEYRVTLDGGTAYGPLPRCLVTSIDRPEIQL